MSKAYLLYLRAKVISFINQGKSKREAGKVLNIGEDTIYRWIRRDKEGSLSPKKRSDFSTKVPHETLRQYVLDHPDHTLKEIGEAVNLSHLKFGSTLTGSTSLEKKDHTL